MDLFKEQEDKLEQFKSEVEFNIDESKKIKLEIEKIIKGSNKLTKRCRIVLIVAVILFIIQFIVRLSPFF